MKKPCISRGDQGVRSIEKEVFRGRRIGRLEVTSVESARSSSPTVPGVSVSLTDKLSPPGRRRPLQRTRLRRSKREEGSNIDISSDACG